MIRKLLIIGSISLLLSGCTLNLPFLQSNQKSGLQITSTPQATVFLDGNSLGITPILEENLKPGNYTIKLTPGDSTIQPWESQVTLTPGVLTVVDRKLGLLPNQSHGHSLSFEKLSNSNSARLAITTTPEAVTVTVDGNPQGFTPVSLDTLNEGDHTIMLTSPGFEDKTIRARTISGYSLNISAQLAKKINPPVLGLDSEATPSAAPSITTLSLTPTKRPTPTSSLTPSLSPQPSPTSSSTTTKPYVEITGDGVTLYVNVRESNKTGNTPIIGQAGIGVKLPYLSSENGWHKVQFQNQTGWVIGTYTKLVQ